MSKIVFDSNIISEELNPKLTKTLDELKKAIDVSKRIAVPSGFDAAEYRSALDKLNKTFIGLSNVKDDLLKAVSNFETSDIQALKNSREIDFDVRLELVDAVIDHD